MTETESELSKFKLRFEYDQEPSEWRRFMRRVKSRLTRRDAKQA